MRSANRKASTPAKPIPPDHSTAASGTLPTEQTKLSTAITGPTTAFSIAGIGAGALCRNRPLNTLLGTWAMKPGQQEADADLAPQHLPVAAEVVGHV